MADNLVSASDNCAAVVAEITSIMGDTRWLILISGGLLTADVAGGAVMVAALIGHADISPWSSVGLLVLVILSWLRSSVLVVLAERPVAGSLGELRRATGAPLDLSAPWPSVGVTPMAASDLEWGHVVPLIGAATLRHERARHALSWSVITTMGLCAWMALSFAIAIIG